MHKAERELEEEEIRMQLQKEKEEEEKINLKILRKQLVHKLNSIRKYRSVEIKHSEKELTNPQSPECSLRKDENYEFELTGEKQSLCRLLAGASCFSMRELAFVEEVQ